MAGDPQVGHAVRQGGRRAPQPRLRPRPAVVRGGEVMKRKVLRLTLLDDVALSERAASAGPHLGLDYIPGATLLGAAARRLYDSLSRDDAFLAFHSGKVRFG